MHDYVEYGPISIPTKFQMNTPNNKEVMFGGGGGGGHDGRLLRTFLPPVSHNSFLAHRDILLFPFEEKLCRIVNATIFVDNGKYFNDLLGYFCRYDVINDARFWREL